MRSWRLARKDERIVGVTAAMASGTGLELLKREMPERFFDVGIAEAHAVGFAAGLAARASGRSWRYTRPSCSGLTIK